jgi:hypothetical protein
MVLCQQVEKVVLELGATDAPGSTVRLIESWLRINAAPPQFSFQVSGVRVKHGATTVSGYLPPHVIQRIVRRDFGKFRVCYEQGLAANPNLAGRVSARFVIGRDGKVSQVSDSASDLPAPDVIACVLKAFETLEFPPPSNGIVTVVYPIMLAPG